MTEIQVVEREIPRKKNSGINVDVILRFAIDRIEKYITLRWINGFDCAKIVTQDMELQLDYMTLGTTSMEGGSTGKPG